jgi:hypothetical protein
MDAMIDTCSMGWENQLRPSTTSKYSASRKNILSAADLRIPGPPAQAKTCRRVENTSHDDSTFRTHGR